MKPPIGSKQTFFDLSTFLGSALGIPAMILAGKMANTTGSKSALLSILIGNFFLWLFGLSVLYMSIQSANAIENIKNYLGKTTAAIFSIFWCFYFLMWYVIQLKSAGNAIKRRVRELDCSSSLL